MSPMFAARTADRELGAYRYQRHQPEHTLLYQIVEQYYPLFVTHMAQQGRPLPAYVQREFEEYLRCGRLEHGFLRVRCDSCHAELLVAFSCKRRGFCPSCGARRMAESAALLVDEVLPHKPMRQLTPGMACSRAMQERLPRVLSFPFQLRFLFASRPAIMGQVLGIVYRVIATHLIKKAGFTKKTAQTGAVTLIQRFGSALNLNTHLMCMDARMPQAHGCAGAAHMLFLDGVYVEGANGAATRFRWVRAPTSEELTQLAHTIAQRIGRFLERQGLLERDAENSYLASDAVDEDPMNQLLGYSITYRIAVGPQQGRKVFTLQTLPACDPEDQFGDTLGKVAGFSLHAGVSTKAHERDKLERLCRYISRPAVSEKRLALTSHGNVRYDVKGFTNVAGAGMRRSDPIKDTVPGRYYARVLRAPGLHRQVGSVGAQAQSQPDPLSWRVRPFMPLFGYNSKHRALVTPARRGKGNKTKMPDEPHDPTPTECHAAMTWAQRLKRVFNIGRSCASLRPRH